MLNNIPLSDVSQFVYPLPTAEHLGCFQVLAIKLEYKIFVDKLDSYKIMSKAVINIHVQVFVGT